MMKTLREPTVLPGLLSLTCWLTALTVLPSVYDQHPAITHKLGEVLNALAPILIILKSRLMTSSALFPADFPTGGLILGVWRR